MIQETTIKQAKILIVDDEKSNVRFLEVILEEAGYTNVSSTMDPREVLALCCSIHPDVLLLDLGMPYLDGFAVMEQIHREMTGGAMPILVLTADTTLSTRHRALKEGARDFLTKPLDAVEVELRLGNLLETRFSSLLLEARVSERTLDLERSQLETLERLALAAEYRDDDTGQHTIRVGKTAGEIAVALGWPPEQADMLRRVAPLHDVGKIGISDSILLKPGKLTEEEFSRMRQHTVIGAKILSGSSSPWLQMGEEIAMTHHERWDGEGYPLKLSGEEISLVGRIVTVADVFDALTHERPYKKAWLVTDATAEIVAKVGSQFDERVVAAFMTLQHSCLI